MRAVVLLLTVAAAFGCAPEPRQAAAAPATPLTALTPAGETPRPAAFEWQGTDAEAVVRIRVFDEAERPLYGIEARGTRVAAPEPLKKLLRPGTRYQWRVSALDENGEETRTSELTPFRITE